MSWYDKETRAAVIGAVVDGVLTLIGNTCSKPPTVTAVSVMGDAPQALVSLFPLKAGNSTFVAPGTMDAREGAAQLQFRTATVFSDLQCINGYAQGSGCGHDIVITGRTGPCGGQRDTSMSCSINGTEQPNQSCAAAGPMTVAGGECGNFWIDVQNSVEGEAYVNCTVRISRIGETRTD